MTYTKHLEQLLLTHKELQLYKQNNLKYESIDDLLDLNFKIDFYLQELLNPASFVTFELTQELKDIIANCFIDNKDLIHTHLQDSIINSNKRPSQTLLSKAKQTVLNLQPNRSSLLIDKRYVLEYNEMILEYLTPIEINYHFQPCNLLAL